jgi:hypothetical protein
MSSKQHRTGCARLMASGRFALPVFSLPEGGEGNHGLPAQPRCVGTARAVRIFKTYGADAIQVMTEWLARDIRGIGFKTADAIAMKLGIEKTAMIRVRAGISYALTEAMDEGHCGLPTEELIPLAEKLLEVPPETHLRCTRSRAAGRHGVCRPGWRNALCISGRSASRI